MTARTFAKIALWLCCITGLAAIAAGAAMCDSASRNRAPISIPTVESPANGPTLLFDAPLRGDTHHRPHIIPTPMPNIEPVLVIRDTIYIRTHQQDSRTLASNIVRDIRRSGGYTEGYLFKELSTNYEIDAIIPAQYIDRIEPLMRKDRSRVNQHYADWSRSAAEIPPNRYELGEQPTSISFTISGRFFDQRWKSDTNAMLFFFGFIIGIVGFIAAAGMTWEY